jgi:hypothetical protein
VGMMNLGSRKSDFRAAYDGEHLPGRDAVPRKHVDFHQDSVGRRADVDAVRIVVLNSPWDNVDFLQRMSFDRLHPEIERGQFFVADFDHAAGGVFLRIIVLAACTGGICAPQMPGDGRPAEHDDENGCDRNSSFHEWRLPGGRRHFDKNQASRIGLETELREA